MFLGEHFLEDGELGLITLTAHSTTLVCIITHGLEIAQGRIGRAYRCGGDGRYLLKVLEGIGGVELVVVASVVEAASKISGAEA